MKFSNKEVKQIIKSWVIVSLAFAIVFAGTQNILSTEFYTMFAMAAFTVGLGFILHELAHKFFGQKYGTWSEFRTFDNLLYIGLALSLFGILFILPGAVYTRGHITKRKMGIIALGGPATNLALGAVFFGLTFVLPEGLLLTTAVLGMQINFWLALFNMLPIWLIDGQKVWLWNKAVWAIFFLASLFAVFGPQILQRIV
jgi:Zn-dependent protease